MIVGHVKGARISAMTDDVSAGVRATVILDLAPDSDVNVFFCLTPAQAQALADMLVAAVAAAEDPS